MNGPGDEEEPEFDIGKRHFVAIATTDYADVRFEKLDKVNDEVQAIRDWLLDERLVDRHFTQDRDELASNPSRRAIEDAFREESTRVDWQWNDAAVIYITGHGDTLPYEDNDGNAQSRHYLVLNSTRKATLRRTGFPTEELFEWLVDLEIDYLLVIVDACFAGSVTERIEGLAKDHWLILPSATSGQRAQLLALTTAISKFLANSRKYNTADPYFRVGMFERELNSLLIRQDQKVKKIYKGGNGDEHFCLPNPAYQPGMRVETAAARRALALPKTALEIHNRVGGSPVAAGWLFSGREELMRRLISAVQEPGVTIVAGSAGCGKSTALSRLVTLSDRKFREQYKGELLNVPDHMWPPQNAVQVAVSAREKSSEDLLAQVCHLLGLRVDLRQSENKVLDYVDALSRHVAAQEPPVTLVIDALDEATEKIDLVKSVLAPLWRKNQEKLCLLIGVRSPGGDGVVGDTSADGGESLADLAEAELRADRIPVDHAPWWDPDDVDVFVRNILANTPGSPYQGNSDAVAGVSAVIREASGSSYLLAQEAAKSLAKRKVVIAADDRSWRAALDEGLIGILREDLKVSVPPEDRHRGVMLLRAVAFARGNGLPWNQVWPKMATAVHAAGGQEMRTYGDPDVEWLLGSRLSAYLVTDRQDDLTVYRLMHDQLRKTLQYHWRELLLDEPAAQPGEEGTLPPESAAEIKKVEARIAWELNSLVFEAPSVAVDRPVPAYVRHHLADHALAGDVLDNLPLWFLPYIDLARFRAAIGGSPARQIPEEDVPWLPVIRRVTHLWDWDHPAANAAAIEMWGALTGALRPARVGGWWQVRWAVGPPDNGNILGRHVQHVWAAATATLSGAPFAVTGGRDGKLHIWDLSKGMSHCEPIQTGGGPIHSIATVRLPGSTPPHDETTIAVTGCADGTVRFWELPSGDESGDPLRVGEGEVKAVTTATLGDGRVVVVAADDAGTIRTWDLVTRRPVGAELPTGPNQALGLATATVGGRVLGLATGKDGGLQIWDLATGGSASRLPKPEDVEPPTTNTETDGRPIAAAVRGEREIAITGYGDKLLIWDLRDRTVTDRLTGNDGTVRSLAVVEQRKDRVIAVTGGNKEATVWDLTGGHTVGEPLTGHDGSVEAVAVVGSADGTLAVSAGRDHTVRLWDIAADQFTPALPAIRQFYAVSAVATAAARERTLAITAIGRDVQVRDLARGTLVRSLPGHASTVVSLTATALPDGDALVVAGGWDGSILAWSAADGRLAGRTDYLHRGAISALATATLADGRIVVITGGWDGEVRVWDPGAGTESCAPLRHGAGRVLALATAGTADGHTLVVHSSQDRFVQVHDLDAHANPGITPSWPPVRADAGVRIASLAIADYPGGAPSVVVGGEDGTVRVLDMRDGALLGDPWPAHAGAVTAVAAARPRDGLVEVFTSGPESQVRAWDISTGRAIAVALPTPGPVRAMAYHAALPGLLIGGASGAAFVQPQHSTR